ncbi:MAG: hypothetical protein ABW094_08745 [Candidatus Thiodiazotropha sp.]
MKAWIGILAVILVSGCDLLSESVSCKQPQSQLFELAWTEQLKIADVEFKHQNGRLCYSEKMLLEARRTEAAAEQIYRGAAEHTKSASHRARVMRWIEKDSRLYDESNLGEDEYLIVVYSGSKAQFEATQVMLNCLKY